MVWITVVVLGFAAGGCGGDDDASPATGDPGSGSESDGSGDVPADEGGAIEGSATDDEFVFGTGDDPVTVTRVSC